MVNFRKSQFHLQNFGEKKEISRTETASSIGGISGEEIIQNKNGSSEVSNASGQASSVVGKRKLWASRRKNVTSQEKERAETLKKLRRELHSNPVKSNEAKAKAVLVKVCDEFKGEIKAEPGSSLADILKNKFDVDLFNSKSRKGRMFLKVALNSPEFKGIPVMAVGIREEKRQELANIKERQVITLSPNEYKQYNDATTLEELAKAIEKKESATYEYGRTAFDSDLNRERVNVKITSTDSDKELNLTISNNGALPEDKRLYPSKEFRMLTKIEQLEAISKQIKQQAKEQGVELDDKATFGIVKEFVLSYRGQAGPNEFFSTVNDALGDQGLRLSLGDVKTEMQFEANDRGIKLMSKTERLQGGNVSPFSGGGQISKAFSFRFIGDKDPKGALPTETLITSKVKRNDEGQITGWDDSSQNNLPKYFVLCGGGDA